MKQRSSLRIIKQPAHTGYCPVGLAIPLRYSTISPERLYLSFTQCCNRGLFCTQDLTIPQKETPALAPPSTTVSSPVCTSGSSLWMVNSDLPKWELVQVGEWLVQVGAGLVMRVTVFHQAVGDVAGLKDSLEVVFFCESVHCPGNHLNSLCRPVPHILSARNKDTVRGRLTLQVQSGQWSFSLTSVSHQEQ